MARRNVIHTRDIDSTGEILQFDVRSDQISRATLIGLTIDGTDQASYAVDLGGPDGDGNTVWIGTDEVVYNSADQDTGLVTDSWKQAEESLRIRVTEAAAAGATADIYIAAARL